MTACTPRGGAGLALAAILIAGLPARAQQPPEPLGASIDGLLSAGHRLSPALRAAALETAAVAATASGAAALDDPTLTDSYSYYKDPGVFSAHTVMLTQAFPLWGKRGLRQQAALADVAASRGRAWAAADALDEQIKVAYAQYLLTARDLAINRALAALAQQMRAAALARERSGGDTLDVISAMDEQTTAKTEAARLQGDHAAARATLNVLVGRAADAPLAEPLQPRPIPASLPPLNELVARAQADNPTLSASDAAINAARSRRTLADKAWYPDVTVGAGPLIQTNHQPVGFSATVGLNIPLPWGREAAGQQTAAAQLEEATQLDDAARLAIAGALAADLAKLSASQRIEVLLRTQALPQDQAAFHAVLARYREGSGALTDPIAALRKIDNVRLQLLQTQLDEQVALAAIERLIGGAL